MPGGYENHLGHEMCFREDRSGCGDIRPAMWWMESAGHMTTGHTHGLVVEGVGSQNMGS